MMVSTTLSARQILDHVSNIDSTFTKLPSEFGLCIRQMKFLPDPSVVWDIGERHWLYGTMSEAPKSGVSVLEGVLWKYSSKVETSEGDAERATLHCVIPEELSEEAREL